MEKTEPKSKKKVETEPASSAGTMPVIGVLNPYDFSELDAYLYKNRKLFQQTAVVIRKGGEIIYRYGDTDTPANAASCSKWLGAAAILRLVERKELDLDAPAKTYANGRTGKFKKKLRPRVKELTLRQLLSHTAGLRSFDPAEENSAEPTVPLYHSVIDGLHFAPVDSTTFCYENAGFNMAGEIATWVAHKPWPALFQDEISSPMVMTRAAFSKQRPALAGGAVISASDYSRFLEMIRNGGVTEDGTQILSKETISEMLKNQTRDVPMRCVPRPSARKRSYGLGMWRQGPDDKPWLASHFGTSGYKVYLDFCRDVTAVFVLQYRPMRKKEGKDATRNVYDIVQRAIPVDNACVKAMADDVNQWTPPLRRPPGFQHKNGKSDIFAPELPLPECKPEKASSVPVIEDEQTGNMAVGMPAKEKGFLKKAAQEKFSDEKPAGSEAMPGEAGVVPAEEEKVPDDKEMAPLEKEKPPVDVKQSSVNTMSA